MNAEGLANMQAPQEEPPRDGRVGGRRGQCPWGLRLPLVRRLLLAKLVYCSVLIGSILSCVWACVWGNYCLSVVQ